jgi:hypothetical protein
LPAKPPDLGYRHPSNSDFDQSPLNRFELERFDDGFDLLHEVLGAALTVPAQREEIFKQIAKCRPVG